MRKLLILIALSVFVLISCEKADNLSMIVVKDCTGSYLRFDEKDYLVCNDEALSSYKNGDEVLASVEKIERCMGGDAVICYMYHPNEGFINIKSVSFKK